MNSPPNTPENKPSSLNRRHVLIGVAGGAAVAGVGLSGWRSQAGRLPAAVEQLSAPGLADAMTDFLVDVCERSQEEQESSEDGGLAEAFDYVVENSTSDTQRQKAEEQKSLIPLR